MCQISFNIYGMKLDKGHFHWGSVTIHFWNNLYQGLNVKYHLNRDTLSQCLGGHPILYRGLKLNLKI